MLKYKYKKGNGIEIMNRNGNRVQVRIPYNR